MNPPSFARNVVLAAHTLAMLAFSCASLGYADDFESMLLDDLIERATPAIESGQARQLDGASSAAGPLASAAEDMRRAAEALRGESTAEWDAALVAQDAALAKLRRLLDAVDAADGQRQLAGAAEEGQTPSSQAEGAGDPPSRPEESSDGSNSPAGESSGDESGEESGEQEGSGRSPGQSGGSDAAAGGGTAAAGARGEAAEVRLREAIDRWQKMQWGMLPPRLREQLGGAAAAEFAEGYEGPTAAYFEELGRRLEARRR